MAKSTATMKQIQGADIGASKSAKPADSGKKFKEKFSPAKINKKQGASIGAMGS